MAYTVLRIQEETCGAGSGWEVEVSNPFRGSVPSCRECLIGLDVIISLGKDTLSTITYLSLRD